MRKNRINKKNKRKFSRYNIIYIAMTLVFISIIVRLLNLQVVQVDKYREKANSNKYKNVSVAAARGDIIDRNEKILATSKQNYVLQYSETEENDKCFFKTMDRVFKILDKKEIPIVDEFEIIINTEGKLEFNFKATSEEDRRWLELRFKKDRGFHEPIIKKIYGDDKKASQLSEKKGEWTPVDEQLLQISAEEVYKTLEKKYGVDKYYELTLEEERRFVIIKDAMDMQSYSGYSPVVISNTLDKETAFIFEQLQPELPGMIVDMEPMRIYPSNEIGSAFLGYMSKINPWEEDKYEEKGYDASTDDIGKAGIEAAYESYLKGTKGQESIEINKQGRRVKTLGQVEAYAGDKVQLNIDLNVQKAADKALKEVLKALREKGKDKNGDSTNATRGAAVAISNTGEILALSSYPGYDPNIFTVPGKLTTELSQQYFSPDLEEMGKAYIEGRGLAKNDEALVKSKLFTQSELSTLSLEERKEMLLDKMFPKDAKTGLREDMYDIFPKHFYNYGTLSLVPPGSTFKPVTALAGLEEGAIGENTLINDVGKYTKNNYGGACWRWNMYHGSHGPINVKTALEESCNYFFYDVADRLYENAGKNTAALDLIAKYGWQLGLGLPSGSELKASTGIEIDENFGQVYNYESSKNTQANVYINQLVGFLGKGIKSTNAFPHYKPFDIVQQEVVGSKEEQAQIALTNEKKKILVDAIKEEIRKDEMSSDNDIISRFTPLIEDIINTNPDINSLGYTEEDVEYIARAMLSSINDGNQYIRYVVNAYDAAIGQGMNTFTPLQLASYIATLVNGGDRYEVKLVDKILDGETGEVIEDIEPELISSAKFSEKNIETIKKGMLGVTSGENGTAATVFKGFPIETGGKTGTSNVVSEELQGALGRDAACVYVGFAPYDDPQIIVCSILFDGAHDGGTIAKAMFEAYFKDEIKKLDPNYDFKYAVDENEAKTTESN